MQIKVKTAVSILALTIATQAHAADVSKTHHHKVAPVVAPQIVDLKPDFSWSGVYLGAQGSSEWGKHQFNLAAKRKMGAKFSEDLDKFDEGVFAGFNRASANGLVFGVETDMLWANAKGHHESHRKDPVVEKSSSNYVDTKGSKPQHPETHQDPNNAHKDDKPSVPTKTIHKMTGDSIKDLAIDFKEKWVGATRVRVGLAQGRVLPYVAGGIAYSNIVTNATLTPGPEANKAALTIKDKSETMIGWTAGAGVDCMLSNNLMARVEYRYSDFGKKSLGYKGENTHGFRYDIKHSIQDVQVGLAYKF